MRWVLRLLLAISIAGTVGTCAGLAAAWSRVQRVERSNELVAEAQRLSAEGEWREAFEVAQTAAGIAPDNPYARRELAMHHIARGDGEAAVRELRTAAAGSPNDAGLAMELGAALAVAGDKEGAVTVLRRAAGMDPGDGVILALLSGCLLETGELAEGLEVAEKAVAVAPRIQAAQFNLGLARWRSGDREGALEAFGEALRLRPSDVSAMICTSAVTAPENANAWAALGGALRRADRPAEARAAFARALDIAPEHPVARRQIRPPRREGGN